MNTKFEMVAKTFQGLEDVLRDELIDLGAEDVEMGRRMVSFRGDKAMLYKANLCLRTALRVLKPIAKFSASDPDELYDFVRDFEWDTLMGPDSTFCIDSTVNSAEFPHSRFVTYRVKDGIVDYFNDKYKRRPSIRLKGADIELNVHISDDRITISLDSSGEPLSKRGYRVAQTDAPLNEVLAAGLLLKTGWRGDVPLVDPMCGSGTFLIEAALIAANINPGVFRQRYAFESWADFDRELFEELYNDDSAERDPAARIYGGDIAREAVDKARENLKAAGVEDFVDIECKPFQEWTEPPFEGMLITNPPYGERLRPGDLEGLYKQLGTTLKRYFKGYHAWILGYKDEHFREIGLKASVTMPVLNGALECQFREYVLFEGSYADFKSGGGSVANNEFRQQAKPKNFRPDKQEWLEQTKEYMPANAKHQREQPDKRQRSERREFKKDRYEQDKRPKSFSGKGGTPSDKKSSKGSNRDYRPKSRPIEFEAKSPALSANSETRFAPKGHTMRSRKGWKKPGSDE